MNPDQPEKPEKPKWIKMPSGMYVYQGAVCESRVFLDGEIWRSQTRYRGELVDCGEWDSRKTALTCGTSAYWRALELRSESFILKQGGR